MTTTQPTKTMYALSKQQFGNRGLSVCTFHLSPGKSDVGVMFWIEGSNKSPVTTIPWVQHLEPSRIHMLTREVARDVWSHLIENKWTEPS